MKWSELKYSKDYYIPFDENQKVIRGFLLSMLGLDLNCIPAYFNDVWKVYPKQQGNIFIEQKVRVSQIIGTSYKEYGDIPLIEAFMKIKRGDKWIKSGEVTKGKYFYSLKKQCDQQQNPILLSKLEDGRYYVDGNGNHRVIFYKIMMLSEIYCRLQECGCEEEYDGDYILPEIDRIFWLNAKVRI